jgi:hypothetical protein
VKGGDVLDLGKFGLWKVVPRYDVTSPRKADGSLRIKLLSASDAEQGRTELSEEQTLNLSPTPHHKKPYISTAHHIVTAKNLLY